jgi:hypothetical protein
MAVNRDVIGHAETWNQSDRTVLDMDSSESAVHGQQEDSAYNGHFESVCYHPLFLFNDHGDCLAAKLRPGNVSSADDWEELPVPEIDRQQAEGRRVVFRADAAFARPAIYEALETRNVGYAIRIQANKNLELAIEDLLFRSPGRPSRKPLIRYKSFNYQADSWTTRRRVVAKVEHHVGELIPTRRIHRHESRAPQSCRRAVLHQARHRRAMDQGGQAGGALDAAVVSSVPGERGPAPAERAGVQPRESLPAAGATSADRHLVADQSPAAPRQDGWAACQARPLLLASAGEKSPDAAAVRVDAPADLGAARADRLTGVRCRRPCAKRGREAGEVSVRMSVASCRASQFGPPVGFFDARSVRRGILTQARSGWCRMRPIKGRQIGNVGQTPADPSQIDPDRTYSLLADAVVERPALTRVTLYTEAAAESLANRQHVGISD